MKSLSHLNKYFFKYKIPMITGILFLSLSNLFGVYAPQLVREAIDYAALVLKSNSNEPFILFSNTSMALEFNFSIAGVFVFLGITYIAVALIKGFFLYLTRQTLIITSRKIEFDLKNEIYEHYQALDLAFYKNNNTGDLMNRISEDVSRVRMYLGPAVMYFINFLVLSAMVIAAMFIINVKLTLYVLLPLPILSITIYYVSMLINQKSEKVQRQLSALSTFTQEAFSGIRVLKAYNKIDMKTASFDKACEDYKEKNLDLVRVDALFMPMIILLIGLSTILTIYIGGKLAIAGEISTGNIAEFVIYVNMLTWPVAAVGWVTSITQRAAASQERINEFLKEVPQIAQPKTPAQEVFDGSIVFDKVSFFYPDSGIQALHEVSFKVNPGKSIAIVGKTGSGKSTIANLLLRMYDPTSGNILINNKNIKEQNLNQLRSKTGYVPQEVFLFSDSIGNNIAFGRDVNEDNRDLIVNAAKDAEVYHNIEDFPKGFETKIGERGLTLSGGQKQRISIARAMIKSPQIIILDDCLSAVDTETEEKILHNLKKLMAGKTSVIISHRISAIKHCEEIIVLKDGKVEERGTHQSLLEEDTWYKQMYEKQLLEEEKSILS